MKYRIKLLTFLLLFCICIVSLKGQFKKKTNKSFPFIFKQEDPGEGYFYLKNATLDYNYGICGFLQQSLKPLAKENKEGQFVIQNDFTISKSRFSQNRSTWSAELVECYGKPMVITPKYQGLFLENTFERPFVLSGIWGKITMNGNKMPYFFYSGSRTGSLNFQNNRINSILDVHNINNSELDLYNNLFTSDTAKIQITDSKFTAINISGNRAKHINFQLIKDSIGDFESNWEFSGDSTSLISTEVFDFYFGVYKTIAIGKSKSSKVQRVSFTRTTFLEGASLRFDGVDTVEFFECRSIGPNTRLFLPSRGKTVLKIVNTDLTNLKFEYVEGFEIYQWSDRYLTLSLYEQLLAKFSAEKNQRSLMNVDIEYFKYRNNNIVNFLASIWWYYGYEKWYIVIWTLGFLVFFSIINTYHWQQIYCVYKIRSVNDITSTRNLWLKFCKVFVFTSLIFFSLRVDFEKLSFKKTGLLLYFFMIYVVGLFCLFFIAKAILQL